MTECAEGRGAEELRVGVTHAASAPVFGSAGYWWCSLSRQVKVQFSFLSLSLLAIAHRPPDGTRDRRTETKRNYLGK